MVFPKLFPDPNTAPHVSKALVTSPKAVKHGTLSTGYFHNPLGRIGPSVRAELLHFLSFSFC